MELFVNRPIRRLQNARSYQPGVDTLVVGRNETLYLKLGFMADNTTVLDNPATAPAITGLRLMCKNSSGAQRFDENAAVDFSAFAATVFGAETFMVGSVPFTSGALDKLLGVDDASAAEITAVQCVADVAGSLRAKSFRVPTAAATWDRIWFQVGGTGTAPAAATGETLRMAIIAASATATAVATALVTLYAGSGAFTVTSVGDSATFTDLAAAPRGNPASLDSGFALTTVAAGKTAFSVADIDSVDLICWLSYLEGGVRQILPKFTITVQNNGMRAGTSPAIYGGTSRTTTTAIGNGVSLVTVTFATPFPHAEYIIAARAISNTTDGSPLTLFPGTILTRTAAGFTFENNGNTDSANYVCDSICYLK